MFYFSTTALLNQHLYPIKELILYFCVSVHCWISGPLSVQPPLKFIWEIVSKFKVSHCLNLNLSTGKVILCIGILVFLNSFPYPYLAEILLDLPLSLLFSKYLSIVIHLLPDQRQSMIPCQAGSFHRVIIRFSLLYLLIFAYIL